MLESVTLGISIGRPWRDVYERVWRPQDFPKWASGLTRSSLEEESEGWWRAQGAEGPVRIRFSEYNAYGVMDHVVDLGTGSEVYVPMRIVANGGAAEVLFTLFRHRDMSDEKFASDAAWVRRDLEALKSLFELPG